jgi:alpha-1,6-mannosyltransferase
MLALLLAGLEIALRAKGLLDVRLLAGAGLVTAAGMVKVPALVALGFLGMEVARRRGGRPRDVLAAAGVLGAVAAAVTVLVDAGRLGWLRALTMPVRTVEWMSVPSDVGFLAGQLGVLVGLGDHTAAVLSLARAAGLVLIATGCGLLLVLTLRGRLDPCAACACGMGAVVLGAPAVQAWYLLWTVVPMAAAAVPAWRWRVAAVAAGVALAALPPGSDFRFRAFELYSAIAAALAVVVLIVVLAGPASANDTGRMRRRGRGAGATGSPTPWQRISGDRSGSSPADR